MEKKKEPKKKEPVKKKKPPVKKKNPPVKKNEPPQKKKSGLIIEYQERNNEKVQSEQSYNEQMKKIYSKMKMLNANVDDRIRFCWKK